MATRDRQPVRSPAKIRLPLRPGMRTTRAKSVPGRIAEGCTLAYR